MTLKQLEAFYWAATCSSFAIAANRLNISVSSLSKRIVELEGALGTELFNRSSRNAAVTPAAQHLLPHARDLLTHAGRFLDMAKSSSTIEGRCRFGVGELTGLTWLPSMMAAMQAEHPNLLMEPTVSVGMKIEMALANAELDFALIAGPSTRPGISSHIIGTAEFTWVSRKVLTSGRDVSAIGLEDLPSLPLVSLPASAGTVRILDDWLADHGVTPERSIICENWGAVAGLIHHGLGLGFLPRAWAEALIAKGALVALDSFPALRPLQYTFQWRRDDTRPLIEQARSLAIKTLNFSAPAGLV
ncbi:LysR family transcriptional regulator [Pseudomonas sp. LB-090624]|uniref:LysR family transcriptional regulator n=1 Tax=Pseudomonas sp. LB-090624 TaxID=2213079 RepID=UPI000D83AC2D|nr:LysR family transcriptional regulator [Pseudomonas sp. LB-090624]PYB78917.1 LysR family transcriptional regulator [Pseudomonas sp. LB-090624]